MGFGRLSDLVAGFIFVSFLVGVFLFVLSNRWNCPTINQKLAAGDGGTQPQASVCGSASTPADCFHWFSVSASCSFGHFVSQHHFAESPAMRLRHLYYRTNADSLSEWNCDTCDI